MIPKQLIFSGKVTNNGLHINNRKEFDRLIKVYIDKPVKITIEKIKSQRSTQQNRFYWMIVGIIKEALKETGNLLTKDETHELLKCKFLKIDIVDENTGEILGQKLGESKKLNKTDFGNYIFDIKEWAKEYLRLTDKDFPNPDENFEINY